MGSECGDFGTTTETVNGAEITISYFEDTQSDSKYRSWYYAWCGSDDDHDRAKQTKSYLSLASALREARNIAKRHEIEFQRGVTAYQAN